MGARLGPMQRVPNDSAQMLDTAPMRGAVEREAGGCARDGEDRRGQDSVKLIYRGLYDLVV